MTQATVFAQLKEIFSNLSPNLLQMMVLSPPNNVAPPCADRLLERCLENLLCLDQSNKHLEEQCMRPSGVLLEVQTKTQTVDLCHTPAEVPSASLVLEADAGTAGILGIALIKIYSGH